MSLTGSQDISGMVQAPQPEEISQIVRSGQTTVRFWQILSLTLGLILGGGTILGIVGKAFYVSREEYVEKSQKDAVIQESLKNTLEALRRSIDNQETAFRNLSDTVYEVKIKIASMKL